jgi:hypothetical protein
LFMGGGLEWVVVGGGGGGLEWVVVGGGGGGLEWVVVGGGGGGGAACVVIVSVGVEPAGGDAVVCLATTVAAASCDGALGCRCCLRLWAGLAAGFGVVAIVVAVVVVAAALAAVWVEVEDADPQALTSSVSSMANAGMRRCFIVVSLPPSQWLVSEDAGRRELLPAPQWPTPQIRSHSRRPWRRWALSSDPHVALLRIGSCVLAQHPPAAPLGATVLTGTTTRERFCRAAPGRI